MIGKFLTLCGLPLLLAAGPHSPSVAHGSVSFQESRIVSSTSSAIVHWKDFSIAPGELVHFVLPSKTAAILNRVTGGSPSVIEGLLQSNGKVYLINPHGIVLTKEGIINTASFVGSTLNLSDKRFLQNDFLFEGSSTEGISIHGQVIASEGDALFISYTIDKTGSIEALRGTAALAAGQRVIVHPFGKERITIVPTESPIADIGISNTGLIQAHQAELKADGNAYALAINDAGFIQASHIKQEAGRIILRADQGTTATNGIFSTDGNVQVLGKHVYVGGEFEGSAIYIGGGRLGTDPEMPNAETVYVDSPSKLITAAKDQGNGGLVSIFGKEVEFYGHIDARGSPERGNGGEVDIIGLKTAHIRGSIDNSAKRGYSGIRNLDPLLVLEPFEASITDISPQPLAPPPIDEIEQIVFWGASLPVINTTPGVQTELPKGFFYLIAFESAEMLSNLKLYDTYVWLEPFSLCLQEQKTKTVQSSFDFSHCQSERVTIKKINYYQADRNAN